MKKYAIALILAIYLLTCFGPVPWLPAISQNSKTVEQTFDNQLSIKLPESANVVANHFSDEGEILHSIYFEDKELFLRGYIQVWKIDDIEKFLVASEKLSTFDFKSFSLKPIAVGPLKGITNIWTASFGNIYSKLLLSISAIIRFTLIST